MPVPKYEQIAGDIRGDIVRGVLEPGQLIPSERELTERWSVTRATVAKAVSLLRTEGLVEARQGVGTMVRERPAIARTAAERYDTAVRTGLVYTAGEHAVIVAAEVVPAPDHVAAALGIAEGEQVVRRQRVTHEGDNPMATSVSWFPGELAESAPRLLLKERIKQGTTRYVEERTGRKPRRQRSSVSPRLATDEELELLRLEGPAAVAEVRHTAFNGDSDQPMLFEVGVNPEGRWMWLEEGRMGPA